ncbi:MAG TPA: alanine--tRNA ligase [Gammaproteobacteria bacterium]|nr:alanine--tRNA ligase [Gammaproteobacteria bacterium]RTZ63946.1 MAG: alanine--tRNA ligase [Gammaproteobacteria bacterium]HIM97916.1 alanine--tRNA ligase [Gammaproteobacteria bacterium]
MKTTAIRQKFLDYFVANGHEAVSSSPLVPHNDPTLLFTNAGMVQFKDVFLGQDKRSYNRAVTSQRCVRAGGKHNDLENVGYTARHHTFFEMLGNFSFGDYFKREAIAFAWELLTVGYGLPEEKLWVTVFEDDDEAADLWLRDVGIPAERFARIGASDNFWAMGDTGPCGPCSEIFYDHGPEVEGGAPGSADADGDRYVEIWNLVFMQYNRDASGQDVPLPKPSVDTGMGLERLAAVLQGVHSNYETDLFQALIEASAQVVGTDDVNHNSLKVIADHIRSTAFLITDGVTPSNEGRGYVLRRIIRRAIRHGHQLGATEPFLHKLVTSLVDQMGDAYPELAADQSRVEETLRLEGERFVDTLEQGIRILDQEISSLSGLVLAGDVAFRLYDTYGFPVDLTADYCREKGLTVDMAGFEQAMSEQRARARAASQFQMAETIEVSVDQSTTFSGYEELKGKATVLALLADGKEVQSLTSRQPAAVVLDTTPVYAESGGQVGDLARIERKGVMFDVAGAHYLAHRVIAHEGVLTQGHLEVGQSVTVSVDQNARAATAVNHSATHLLHAALQQVLGSHVQQKGSLVEPQRLRFDFSHNDVVTADQLENIEMLVNTRVRANDEVTTEIMPLDDAREQGAAALFGEKYDDDVRVVDMGGFSLELCGGTHVTRTGNIGLFRIVSESGIAAGVRRIEALAGDGALKYVLDQSASLTRVAQLFRTSPGQIEDKASQMQRRLKELERKVEQLQAQLAAGGATDQFEERIQEVNGIKLLVTRHDGVAVKGLRVVLDRLRDKLGSGVVVIGGVHEGKVTLLAGVTRDLVNTYHAGRLISVLAPMVGGKGGGKADMAQGGGSDASALDAALAAVPDKLSPVG